MLDLARDVVHGLDCKGGLEGERDKNARYEKLMVEKGAG